ncbi:hypothetical protein BYT27DRAFT_7343517 [Phlegmacium glaucopus]|nr:hypothetical protein BYT27DRAFT_7343517 [Phlegmacium glaucopus]
MLPDLDNTLVLFVLDNANISMIDDIGYYSYGAVFISVVVAAAYIFHLLVFSEVLIDFGSLYGVSCVQTLYYFTNQNDPWYIKLTVTLLMVLDTVNQVVGTHLGVYLPNRNAPGASLIDVAITVYTFSITNWGNAAQPVHIWSVEISVIFTVRNDGVDSTKVHLALHFAPNIGMTLPQLPYNAHMATGNIYLAGSSMILVLASFGSSVYYIAKATHFRDLASFTKVKHESMAINILGAVTDLLIAAILCTLLNLSSDTLINKLILFSVNTGLITSFFALASMVLVCTFPSSSNSLGLVLFLEILVAGNTFIYISFFFCLGRLYTNSLLSTLNAREMIRSGSHQGSVDVMSLSLRNLPKGGSVQGEDISIKIDTNTSKYPLDNDQKLYKAISRGQHLSLS